MDPYAVIEDSLIDSTHFQLKLLLDAYIEHPRGGRMVSVRKCDSRNGLINPCHLHERVAVSLPQQAIYLVC